MSTETETAAAVEGELIQPEQPLATLDPNLREQAVIARGRDMDATQFVGSGNAVFASGIAFQLACKMADWMAAASILPEAYAGKPANCLVAIDYAARLGVSPIQLAQNMDVVKGRPGLRGTFLAGLINASPLFSRLKYEWRGTDNPGGEPSLDFGCRAYATEIATGDVLYGAWIDWRMVKGEGWDSNKKWTHLRVQMFTYRSAAFWSRAHASDVTLGLHETEELRDAERDYGTQQQPRTSVRAITSADAVGDMAAKLAEKQGKTEPQKDGGA